MTTDIKQRLNDRIARADSHDERTGKAKASTVKMPLRTRSGFAQEG